MWTGKEDQWLQENIMKMGELLLFAVSIYLLAYYSVLHLLYANLFYIAYVGKINLYNSGS